MFYDFKLEVLKKETIVNELFQSIDSYTIDYTIDCDIQPSSQDLIKKTFGEIVESLFIVFADEQLDIGTIVRFNNIDYIVNKKVPWISYTIYSLKGI